MNDLIEIYRRIEYLRNNGLKMKEIADYVDIAPSVLYKPQNKMFHFCKTFCSKITLVNTIQNVILNPI